MSQPSTTLSSTAGVDQTPPSEELLDTGSFDPNPFRRAPLQWDQLDDLLLEGINEAAKEERDAETRRRLRALATNTRVLVSDAQAWLTFVVASADSAAALLQLPYCVPADKVNQLRSASHSLTCPSAIRTRAINELSLLKSSAEQFTQLIEAELRRIE